MRRIVLVTGATGFVGRALLLRLLRGSCQPIALVRDLDTARSRLGREVELVAIDDDGAVRDAMSRASAVVNLAGENLFAGRWTPARKQRLIASRVGLTRRLVSLAQAAETSPSTWIQASAVGWYGDSSEAALDESAPSARDFLAEICSRWEEATSGLAESSCRIVRLRIGLVLGPEEGLLGRLAPIFRLGLGGRLGSGDQGMSWIHVEDLVELIFHALSDPEMHGAVNATAPHPVDNRTFTRTLARLLGRPALAPVPGFLLRLVLGESAAPILGGQRVVPRRAEARGFRFRHPRLEDALSDILRPETDVRIQPSAATDHGDLPPDRPRPQYDLGCSLSVPDSLPEVFPFFSRAENLGLITPPWTNFRIQGSPPDVVRAGTVIDYTIRLGPFPIRWRTLIATWDEPHRFVDEQKRGPYRLWWHEHRFEQRPDGTTGMTDRVLYRLPLGWLGRVAHFVHVSGLLRRIFAYRTHAIRLRFGRTERPDR